MTDKEIIKVIEYCKNNEGDGCRGCVLYGNEKGTCIDELLTNTLALINRQQAEIEGLQNLLYNFLDTRNGDLVRVTNTELEIIKKPIKTEAIKEFAECLKGEFAIFQYFSYSVYSKIISIIDNLVKEMVGEQE